MELIDHTGRHVLDVFWDTGEQLEFHLREDGKLTGAITVGPREAQALRNWLIHTTLTQQMDAPEVEAAYLSGLPLPCTLPDSPS